MKNFQIDIKFIPCNCNIRKDMSRMMGHFENIKKELDEFCKVFVILQEKNDLSLFFSFSMKFF